MLNKVKKIALMLISSKVADLILSPKTTIPALINAAGAPSFFVSLLVPIRESGSLLPQILFSLLLKRVEKRHIAWRLGSLVQFFSTVFMLFSAFYFQGVIAGVFIITFLLFFSISRALVSLTNKDIQGMHINKGSRGKLIGSAGTLSSLISVTVAVLAWYFNTDGDLLQESKLIFLAMAALSVQLFSILIIWPVKTRFKLASDDDSGKLKSVLKMSKSLKMFILVRSLMSHSALIAPLVTLSFLGNTTKILAFLIIAQASAGLVSSYFWGLISDKKALFSMRFGACIAGICSFVLFIASYLYPHYLSQPIFIVSLFFVLCIGHQGIRIGRKIYAIDIAQGQQRTEFIAKSNSVVGSFILIAGIAYSAMIAFSMTLAIGVMTIGLLASIVFSFFLKSEK